MLTLLAIAIICGVSLLYYQEFMVEKQVTAVCDSELCLYGCYPGTNNCIEKPPAVDEPYMSFALAHVYAFVKQEADPDSAFGVGDVYGRVYEEGAFDFTGDYVDTDGTAATSGQLDWSANKMFTDKYYDVLLYQGDGGTSVYPKLVKIYVGKVREDATASVFTVGGTYYIESEGTIADMAWDCTTDNDFDESTDTITFNKSGSTVEGCETWEVTIDDSGSGTYLIDPVLIFRDDPSSAMTDINDIEHIYLSLKTGQGIGFYDCDTGAKIVGDAVDYFLGAEPICLTDDGRIDQQDSATITVQICLPATEAELGNGQIQVIFDDMGDYRGRSLNNDVQAAADVETIVFQD
jgi:hypothetical protein